MLLFADAATSQGTFQLVAGLIAIPLLVAVNGFFVAAEFALVSIRRTRVEELVNQKVHGAASLMYAISDLSRSVAVCQLGITVASLALGFVSEPAIHSIIQPALSGLPADWARVVSILLTLSLITYMHVVFGEQMPKIAALQEYRAHRTLGRPPREPARALHGTDHPAHERFELVDPAPARVTRAMARKVRFTRLTNSASWLKTPRKPGCSIRTRPTWC